MSFVRFVASSGVGQQGSTQPGRKNRSVICIRFGIAKKKKKNDKYTSKLLGKLTLYYLKPFINISIDANQLLFE